MKYYGINKCGARAKLPNKWHDRGDCVPRGL